MSTGRPRSETKRSGFMRIRLDFTMALAEDVTSPPHMGEGAAGYILAATAQAVFEVLSAEYQIDGLEHPLRGGLVRVCLDHRTEVQREADAEREASS